MPVSSMEATAMLDTLPTPMVPTATGATAMPPPTASATVATGRGLLMPSPRLRPMPLFCTEATATATPPPLPTGATPMLPTPTAPTPAPTTMVPAPTATASATAATGNLLHPYVHIRGHHLRAGCLGVGEWSGIQRTVGEDLSNGSKKIFKQEQEDPEWIVNATESVCPQFPWEFDLEAFSFQLIIARG